MLFNSYEFIFIFLPITFFLYFYLNKKRLVELSKVFLIISSLFFYSYWNIAYLPILLASMAFNYSIAIFLTKDTDYWISKKHLLLFGIASNIALLGYFKYSDFFLSNMNNVLGMDVPLLHLALPLAISFFTFQQIAYLVDSYRGMTKEYDLLNYAVFVSFFPQLIAGPIVHHKEMMPQFANMRNQVIHYKNIALGLFIFFIGLFKKIVIADTFAIWAILGFDKSEVLTFYEAWLTSLSYTFQLYFDFSGYTDMAIGIGLLFNIKLPTNFNSPYKASNIQDFWRRWHITLSKFLKDYVYIPLGGNRKGNIRTLINLMTTFLLAGLWHGAGWTFVFWGFLHGLALIIHRIWNQLGFKLNRVTAWIVTFNFVNLSWIFFRAHTWDDAIKVLSGMLGLNGFILPDFLSGKLMFLERYGINFGECIGDLYSPLWIVVALITIIFFNNSVEMKNKFSPSLYSLIFITIVSIFGLGGLSGFSEFLYFNF